MARNSEKAMAMLNRWQSMKQTITRGSTSARGRRPRMTNEAQTIQECEHWRSQVLREAAKKISEIQNAGHGEARIRELNDEINAHLREKGRWEERIRDLGGPDLHGTAIAESCLVGQDGYKYFGAAKDLPGVRELFERQESVVGGRATRAQLRGIKPDYYGWGDEDCLELLEEESRIEKQKRTELLEEWTKSQADKPEEVAKIVCDNVPTEAAGPSYYVSIPCSEEIEKMLIQKKKAALLNQIQ
eukprot:GHVO01016646.1.p1 GENE.GHVO01016646.1~~GHVO01016646.1.p1  ORF type:complete len:244 (+),score=35.83 GHVO01016646.1:56-787(+)